MNIKAIRESHIPLLKKNHPMLPGPENSTACIRCDESWPCKMIQVIDYYEEILKWIREKTETK